MRIRKLTRPEMWMAGLLFGLFVVTPAVALWGAYKSLTEWQGCSIISAPSVPGGVGYSCPDGRKYP
jgi:hypothetical protein